jgi:ankyrin repeat protein
MKNRNVLIGAAKRGNLKTIETLLAAGGDVDLRDEEEVTPLMHASEQGRQAAVVLLLRHGADVNALSEDGNSALTLAANAGHAHVVRLLLERGAEPNVIPRYRSHALGAAAAAGDWALCELLLAHGADINAQTDWHTALSLAAWREHEELACRLTEAGADVDLPDAGDYVPVILAAKGGMTKLLAQILERTHEDVAGDIFTTAMTEAAGEGRAKAVAMLLERGCQADFDDPHGDDSYVSFPLRTAAKNGEADIVGMLLAHGARINEESVAGTALAGAAQFGHSDVVDMLLSHGADTASKDMYNRDALGWAIFEERPRLAERLLIAGAWPAREQLDAAFLLVVQTDNVELARRLLDAGADLQACLTRDGIPHNMALGLDEVMLRLTEALTGKRDEDDGSVEGTTALMLAAGAGCPATVDFLLACGADPNARNRRGDTALILAPGGENIDVVRRLVDAGADVNAVDETGWSPVLAAAGLDDPAIVILLLDRGGNIHCGDEEGWTAVIQALCENRTATARCLIDRGADVLACCADGYSALMAAARDNCVELLDVLVSRGADLHGRWVEKDRDALMLAAINGQTAAVRRLLELGADFRAENRDGDTAYGLASEKGHIDVCELLLAWGAEPSNCAVASETDMAADPDYRRRLVAQLQRCMPELDAEAMLATSLGEDGGVTVLDWLYDGLKAQDLMCYEEWKEYWGDLPVLQPLEDIDLQEFSAQPLLDLMEKDGYPSFPDDPPYFEYQSHFLKRHGLRMLTLAYENIYMLCVRDDAAEIGKLDSLLAEAGIALVDHAPMNLKQCARALKQARG